MALEIKTAIVVKAEPHKVWEVLMNFENYSNWNPFIKSIIGIVEVGNQIKVQFEEMKFKPKVLVVDKNNEFKWLGHLFIKGLFDGEHCFKLRNNKNGMTTFLNTEKFSGILVPLFKNKLMNETNKGFEEMNKSLQTEVESNVNCL